MYMNEEEVCNTYPVVKTNKHNICSGRKEVNGDVSSAHYRVFLCGNCFDYVCAEIAFVRMFRLGRSHLFFVLGKKMCVSRTSTKCCVMDVFHCFIWDDEQHRK